MNRRHLLHTLGILILLAIFLVGGDLSRASVGYTPGQRTDAPLSAGWTNPFIPLGRLQGQREKGHIPMPTSPLRPNSAAAEPSTQVQSAGHTWEIERVDAPKLFTYMGNRSLALDADGHPHIAYGKDFLYYAHYDGAQWQLETVDDSPGVGRYTSLSLDASGHPHISYYDDTNDNLKYAYYDGTFWQIQTVDSDVGWSWDEHTSLALDTAGRPHISYCRSDLDTSPCTELRYAHYDGTSWYTETVDAGEPPDGGVGGHNSLVLDQADRPVISYYDATNDVLKFAWHDGTFLRQGSGQAWHTETVDNEGGTYTSLALDTSGRPHISYHGTYPNDDLKYAYHDGTAWYTETVDSAGNVGWYTSLTLDTNDHPHIGYCLAEIGGNLYYCHDLKYAHHDGSLGQGRGWQIETIADGGSFTSLALDAAGRPHISHCWYSPYGDKCQGLQYAYYDGAEWRTETVDNERRVGSHVSLALNTAGQPHISYCGNYYSGYRLYYCAALRYAHYDGVEWQIETVGSGGESVSLALDAAGRPHVSYFEIYPSYRLKYAHFDGSDWQIETVSGGGYYSSLALDAQGQPHIGYSAGGLKYARFDGSTWQIETVDGAGDVGDYPCLALDANGHPHVSYYDESNGDLKYAYHDGTSWITETVDAGDPPGEGNVGRYTSLALDTSGSPHISYCRLDPAPASYTCDDLKYAYYDGTSWHIETVDTGDPPGDGNVGGATSLALDSAGQPHISYHDSTNGNLKHAYYDGAALPSGSWHIETVDAGGSSGEGSVGSATSLALDPTGRPHIGYIDGTNADLKYAHSICVGVEQVTVDGPPALLVDQVGTYRATAQPITASRPLTFTWDSGAVGDTATYSWPTTGTYTLTVTATNVCGGVQTASSQVQILAEWLYSFYLPLVVRNY